MTSNRVLVVGSGVSGWAAALNLASSGVRVSLIEQAPFLGGTLSQIERQFPTNRCLMCTLLPVTERIEAGEFCLRRDFYHPLIDVHLLTSLKKVEGKAGQFTVSLETRPRYVVEEACTACGKCEAVCPVEMADPFNGNLSTRKAIYARVPQGIPNVYCIDETACTRCGKCVEACPTQAIDLDQSPKTWKLEVASVVVAAGFDLFDPTQLMQYGWGRYPDVLTSLQLERLLSETGPTGGRWVRQATGEPVKKLAFIQCVGSRDLDHPYCSSACCMIALKEAMFVKEVDPEIDATLYYMDLRDFGKGYTRYRMRAEEMGVRFVASRVPDVKYNPKDKQLVIRYMGEDGTVTEEQVDQVVLSVGQSPSDKSGDLADLLGLERDEGGYLRPTLLNTTATRREGLYICGSVREPKDIPDAICEGEAAAAQAIRWVEGPVVERSRESHPEVELEPPKVGVFLCQCGDEIRSRLDLVSLAEELQARDSVSFTEIVEYLCVKNAVSQLVKRIKESGINRVVFAACAPYRFEHQFREILKEAGLPENLMAIVGIREQVAWVHEAKSETARRKAAAMVHAAIDKMTGEIPKLQATHAVTGKVLVIGGGVAGLTVSRSLAAQGVAVDLVEIEETLGGNFRSTHFLLGGSDPQALLDDLIEEVRSSDLVRILTRSRVLSREGSLGRYVIEIETPEGTLREVYGGVVIATGAKEHEVSDYSYGQHPAILTMREFGEKLSDPSMPAPDHLVMIQCVGSREGDHPYCSRYCCSKALAHAMEVKQRWPETQVTILFRDIMAYGNRERAYTEAREMGIHFFRYGLDAKPVVETGKGDGCTVRFRDPVLGGDVTLTPDFIVLSNGAEADDRGGIGEIFSLGTTEDGFFEEAEVKFRPVDAHEPGIWICGLALGPKNVNEVIVQAEAAAARALAVLRKQSIQLPHVKAWVSPRRCSACEMCVPACPYNARVKDEDLGYVVVREALCQGCGVCTTVCPNNAVKLISYQENQIFAMIDRMALG